MPKYNMTMREFGQLIEEYKLIEEMKEEAKRYYYEGKRNLYEQNIGIYTIKRMAFINKFTLETRNLSERN